MNTDSPQRIAFVIEQVSEVVSKLAGIQLGQRQSAMVESRLRNRLVKLNLGSFDEYLTYLRENFEKESMALLSLLTTHHTFFFREFGHFEYILNHGLPQLIEAARQRGDKKIRIWSAASSRGQEAYSLAMFMQFHLSATAPDIDFEIWGTDIDPDSVKMAQNGVYKAEELKQAPAMYVNGNWVRGTGNVKDYFKVKDGLKTKCRFQTANLLSCDAFLSQKMFDIIFCRNVFIYFDSQQIKSCSKKLLEHLNPAGLLVLGVSESINGLNLPAMSVGPSVYRHPEKSLPKEIQKTVQATPAPDPVYRVLSVDDSPAILALLKKIMGEKSGFEVVATASNGLQALDILKSKKVDVITLDLHMPEMDGLGFLEAYKDKTVPVVIVSAINRDDMSIAQKALALGASDYVEKPSLENFGQASNEIRSKLKTVIKNFKSNSKTSKQIKVGKKRVLIVDDSPTIRQLLEKIISEDPGLEVVGKAERPSQVEELIRTTKPDLITLDIHMPEMSGVELLKRIHPKYGIPTVMISSISREEGPQVLQALESGAIDYIQKPEMNALAHVAPQIRERLKIAAQSQYKKRQSPSRKGKAYSGASGEFLLVIGASTGGTEAIRSVLEGFPSQIPPTLIVQHIPAGFSAAFADRLNQLFPFEVKEAKDGDEICANRVLIAPGGLQMGVKSVGEKLFATVTNDPPANRHKPSVDYLFRSVAKTGRKNVAAAILTGMGSDGARGLKDLRLLGARTVAQDQDSCVVFGMPREAIELGAAEFIKPLHEISEVLMNITHDVNKNTLKKTG